MERQPLVIIAVLVVVVAILAALTVVYAIPAFTAPPQRMISAKLWYTPSHYGSTERDVATVLASSLNEVPGLEISLDSLDWATYIERFVAGRMGMFLLGWYPDFIDPDNYLEPFLGSEGAKSLGSEYNSTLMNEAILRQRALDQYSDERDALLHTIQEELANQAAYIPLYQATQHVVYEDDVTGIVLNPAQRFFYWNISKPGTTTLFTGTTDEIHTLDPADAYDYFSINLIEQVFDTLLTYDDKGNLIPLLAQQIPTLENGGISSDGLTYTYDLKPNLVFSNGDELDANDVAYSILRNRDIRVGGERGDPSFLLDIIDTVVATDSDTVVVTLNNPFSAFNAFMALWNTAPLHPDSFPTDSWVGEVPADMGDLIGAGPYVISEWIADERVTLVRNDNYGDWATARAAQMDTVTIRLLADATALRAQVQAGDISVAYRTLNPEDITDLQDEPGLVVDIKGGLFIRYIVFNVQTPPFDDVNVRRAIAAAIDRQEIIDTVLAGQAEPLYSMVPAGMFGYEEVFKDEYGVRDLDMAEDYLNEFFETQGLTILLRELAARPE